MTIVEGIGVGSGIAWGRVFILEHELRQPIGRRSSLEAKEELSRLQSGLALAFAELEKLASATESDAKDIMAALMLALKDTELMASAQGYLDQGWNAETALSEAMASFSNEMIGIAGFQERIADLDGLVSLVINKMNSVSQPALSNDGPIIVVAEDLTPIDTLRFNESVVGVITKNGGPTSHAAIICRQLGIPALVAAKDGFELLIQGFGVRIDALHSQAELTEIEETVSFDLPEFLIEDCLIPVLANIGSASDAFLAKQKNAAGVGLFRTELVFLARTEEPTISEQQGEYRKIFLASPDGDLIVRTLDLSLDKPITFLDNTQTVLNQNSEVLERQLEAIKRAADAVNREVSIMAPMVKSVTEVEMFSDLARKAGFSNIGVMVETVEITKVISQLAGLVDFVSIGTNDLSSELFEQDRLNPREPMLLDPWQPKLIRTISSVVDQAKVVGIKVGVCGEAASDPNLAVVLAGLGVDSVSVGAGSVSLVGNNLAGVSKAQAVELADLVLESSSLEQAKLAAAAFIKTIEG